MRILHIVHQYPPDHVGGVELYTQGLAHELTQRGHAVTVFTRRDGAGAGWRMDEATGAPVYRAWAGALTPPQRFLVTWGNRALVDAFAAALDQTQPDLVHVQHLMGLPTQIIDLLRSRNLPYLVTLHDYWWVCANANLLTNYSQASCTGPQGYVNCTRCLVARAGRPLLWAGAPAIVGGLAWRVQRLRSVLASAAHLLTPSDFVRRWHAAHGIPGKRIQVLGLGVERPPADFTPPQRVQNGVIRLLYLGGIAPLKGVHVIIEALREVRGDVELWVAGDLTADPQYVQQLPALSTPQVRFLGRLGRRQVWETLAQVDALLTPSLWHETYCLTAREAQVAGVPVLASPMGALSEAVTHEVNGLLIAPGDVAAWRAAIQRCVDEPGLLARWRAQITPPPTIQEHVDELEMVYQCVMRNA